MSEIDNYQHNKPTNAKKRFNKEWLLLPVWVLGSFILAQLIVVVVQLALLQFGAPLANINQVVYTTLLSAITYALAMVIVVGVPLGWLKKKTTRKSLGVHDWPSWMDILISVPAYVVYLILSGVLLAIIMQIFPDFIDLNQSQQLPLSQSMLSTQLQYFLAFLTFVVLAPLAEELLFRGYLYGKLRKTAPVWLSVIIASLAFGVAHLWAGPDSLLQWAVMIDTFALSVVLCLLREHTGALWASVLLHAIKNGLAFYLVFVDPQTIEQLRSAMLPLIGVI